MNQSLNLVPPRSSQKRYFRFGYTPGAKGENIGVKIGSILQEKFGIGLSDREMIAKLIIQKVPTSHKNIFYLVAAAYVVYDLDRNQEELTSKSFENYFSFLSKGLKASNPKTAKSMETEKGEMLMKVTLLRYIYYVLTFSKEKYSYSK